MSMQQALIDFVGSIAEAGAPGAASRSPLAGAFVEVQFAGGRRGQVDTSTVQGSTWHQVLESLQRAKAPAYVELDDSSDLVTRLLVPLVVKVGAIERLPGSDDLDVELVISHARHTLRKQHPQFDQLLAMLKTAHQTGRQAIVTETPHDHEIIAVALLPEGSGGPQGDEPTGREGAPADAPAVPPTPEASTVSLAQARALFDMLNARVCCPQTAAAPCIPFVYPDDGCWGRAHEMVRLMALQGVQADKVWIFGSLRVATANNPRCEVRWGWHVAPTLTVNTGSGAPQTYVIDPSLFPQPVPRATWAGVQGDPAAALVPTGGDIFWRDRSGANFELDPTFSKTDAVLNRYRNNLRLRAVGSDGPPPYPACLAPKPGVQFYGTIAAGATHSWFTFGWPAAWHVLWSVMPTTACPGAAQLKLRTRVERASAANATYWLAVTNTTNSTLRFEGRFDVLRR